MKYIYLLILSLLLVSCNSKSGEKHENDFDLPLLNKSEALLYSGKYESLVMLNSEYFKKAKQLDYEEGQALCYINIANVNVTVRNFKKSLTFFEKARKLLDHSPNNIHKAIYYNSYGKLYYMLKLYDNALESNTKALNYLKHSRNSELKVNNLALVYSNRGDYLFEKKQTDSALIYYHKASRIKKTAITEGLIAEYHLQAHRPDSAAIYIQHTEDIINKQHIKDVRVLYLYYLKGMYYNEINEYDKADAELQKALKLNIEYQQTFSAIFPYIYWGLVQIYKKKGDTANEYFYLKKYIEEKQKTDTALSDAVNFATESFISDAKKETDRQRNNILILVVLSVIWGLLGIMYAWRIIKSLRLKRKLLKMEAEALKNQFHDKKFEEVVKLARKNDSTFLTRFKEVYPDFIDKLLEINPDLENSELAFCAMLKLHFSSKDIASYTYVQHKSIQQKKYRIRKKLNIPGNTDIYKFFDEL
ncbi:tetratricopeptide repeat protein [Chryseobacterium gossypii]|uniref:tetratricopeptide repeat protein n=1 Tax=Chryseobacterium gossypii TaxID=3231602 RepID=UPI00352593B3